VITPGLPKNGQLHIQSVHPGYKATAASEARGKTKHEQRRAYKAAMKALQDDYYENVAPPEELPADAPPADPPPPPCARAGIGESRTATRSNWRDNELDIEDNSF
jgi:hypothetical protein